MGGTLYNKIPVGRRAAFYHFSRVKLAVLFGTGVGIALIVASYKL
jgi:hypothetical protein